MSGPTVQELLHDCAREVRSIMWDVTTLDGPALAAAWPAFAHQAGAALVALPAPDPGARLLAWRVLGPRPRPNRWGPSVDAAPDAHLMRASDALAGVAQLLRRYASPPTSREAGRDGDLVCRRIAECLMIASHSTALGLHEHATQLVPARAGIAFERPGVRLAVAGATLSQSRRLASELDTLEGHAAHYLLGPLGRGPARRCEQFVDPDRLPAALAQWEITALRVLHGQPPSVCDLLAVAHAEQALLVHTMVILTAAADAAVIDHGGFIRQIRPRLEVAHVAWGAVAASWPAQMSTPASPSLAGLEASAQLHQALGEITRDCDGWATSALIAARIDPAEVVDLLRGAAMASVNRAHRFAELPGELAHGGYLHAPARLLAAMERQASGLDVQRGSAVRTTDIANRRIVAVRLEQTTVATAQARVLGRQLMSLVQALETMPLGRPSPAVVEPTVRAQAPVRALSQTRPELTTIRRVGREALGR